jgi:lysozyme family protein
MKFFEWLSNLIKQFFAYFENIPSKPESKPKPLPKPGPADLKELAPFKKGTLDWYRKAFELCRIDAGYESAVRASTNLVLKGKDRYLEVERATGVPWFVIGAIHFKEATCNWKSVLHNGEQIVGTGRKTTIVPIGRGPFDTWQEAAIDAMKGESLGKIKDWELGAMLMACEKYNGWGYQTGAGKAENSPYLWARSNINDDFGKYVRDGVFDPNATTQKTTGLAVILKELELMGEIKLKKT